MPESQITTNTIAGFREGLTGYVGVIGSDHAYIHLGIGFTSIIDYGS